VTSRASWRNGDQEAPAVQPPRQQAIAAFQDSARADAMTRTEVGDDIVYGAEARLAHANGEGVTRAAEESTK
jgi:hypothetical protein